MDEIALQVKYKFSDQATKDRMIVDTMLQVALMRKEILELRQELTELKMRKGVPRELQELDERSKRPKIIS